MADEHYEKTGGPRGPGTKQQLVPKVSYCPVTVTCHWAWPHDLLWLLELLDNSDSRQAETAQMNKTQRKKVV